MNHKLLSIIVLNCPSLFSISHGLNGFYTDFHGFFYLVINAHKWIINYCLSLYWIVYHCIKLSIIVFFCFLNLWSIYDNLWPLFVVVNAHKWIINYCLLSSWIVYNCFLLYSVVFFYLRSIYDNLRLVFYCILSNRWLSCFVSYIRCNVIVSMTVLTYFLSVNFLT